MILYCHHGQDSVCSQISKSDRDRRDPRCGPLPRGPACRQLEFTEINHSHAQSPPSSNFSAASQRLQTTFVSLICAQRSSIRFAHFGVLELSFVDKGLNGFSILAGAI